MRLFLMAAFAMSMFVAGSPASAQTADAPPHWLKQPSTEDLVAVFPRVAARLGHSGRVQLSCSVQPDGGLSRCAVLSEDPGDEGFGDAALKLSKLYKIGSPDGSPLPRSIDLPIKFPLSP